jgi:hypothetical protein
MTIERYRHPDRDDCSNESSPLPPRRGHLDELRKKAERVSQSAQDAITKALGAGDAEQQLRSLRNTGGE